MFTSSSSLLFSYLSYVCYVFQSSIFFISRTIEITQQKDWFGYVKFVWQYMQLPRLCENTEFYSQRQQVPHPEGIQF